MTVENEKSYEEIVKELQAQIDERKQLDHMKEMYGVIEADLVKKGYYGGYLENALDAVSALNLPLEDEKDALRMANKINEIALANPIHKPKSASNIFKY